MKRPHTGICSSNFEDVICAVDTACFQLFQPFQKPCLVKSFDKAWLRDEQPFFGFICGIVHAKTHCMRVLNGALMRSDSRLKGRLSVMHARLCFLGQLMQYIGRPDVCYV